VIASSLRIEESDSRIPASSSQSEGAVGVIKRRPSHCGRQRSRRQFGDRKFHAKARAGGKIVLHVDASAVFGHDAGAMADPSRAAVLVRNAEGTVCPVFRRDAVAVSETQISTVSASKCARGKRRFRGTWNFQGFRRIVDEIHDHASQQRAVRPDGWEIFR